MYFALWVLTACANRYKTEDKLTKVLAPQNDISFTRTLLDVLIDLRMTYATRFQINPNHNKANPIVRPRTLNPTLCLTPTYYYCPYITSALLSCSKTLQYHTIVLW